MDVAELKVPDASSRVSRAYLSSALLYADCADENTQLSSLVAYYGKLVVDLVERITSLQIEFFVRALANSTFTRIDKDVLYLISSA